MMDPARNAIDAELMAHPGDRRARDSGSARDQSSPFNPLALHRNVDPTLDAEDTQSANGTELSVGRATAMAQPQSTRAASTSLVAGVPVNRTGLIFDDSDVRYPSRAELEKLSQEQL